MTQFEQIFTLGRATSRSLRIQEISAEEARRQWRATWPASVVDMLLDAWAAALDQPAFVTFTFEEITGSKPRSFLDWAVDHVDELQA